jgi:hypothetical protein
MDTMEVGVFDRFFSLGKKKGAYIIWAIQTKIVK